jgi:CRP/FNR family transcriptional regulator, cyclic AMP receptor protein
MLTNLELDLLSLLPRKPLQSFVRGQSIYSRHQPTDSTYIVITGSVKVTYSSEGGDAVARMVRADGMFGESCLIGARPAGEAAMALDHTTLMAWSCTEIEQQIEREPRLGLHLSQYLIRQSLELQDRIECSASYKTPDRVMLAIAQLAKDLGTRLSDGSLRMPPLTHHTIAEYVGTSREIVTFQMNRLRRLGMLTYSRKKIEVSVQALYDELHQRGVVVPDRGRTGQHVSASGADVC